MPSGPSAGVTRFGSYGQRLEIALFGKLVHDKRRLSVSHVMLATRYRSCNGYSCQHVNTLTQWEIDLHLCER